MISTNNKGTTKLDFIVYPSKLTTNKNVKPALIVKGIPTLAFGNHLRASQGLIPPTIPNSSTNVRVIFDTVISPTFVSMTKFRVVMYDITASTPSTT